MEKTGKFKRVKPYFNKAGNIKDWYIEITCECGNVYTPLKDNYIRGKSITCGCKKGNIRHNKARNRIYKVWAAMLQRCNNKLDKKYYRYGGRGITVTPSWLKFDEFYKDMGEPPSNKWSLDRIDNDSNYEPINCWWALITQQNRNKSDNVLIKVKNELLIATEYCRLNKWPKDLISKRIYLGWSLDRAINTPYKSRG